VIIRDAHWLSEEAQNALLKTLEEPNTSSVLILVTHAPEQLLETVRSRLVREAFSLVAEADIEQAFPDRALAQVNIPVFFRSFGRPGLLVRALEEPEAFQAEKSALTQLYRISLLSVAERLKLAEELSKNIPQTKRVLSWWLPGLYERAQKETELKRISQYFTILTEINRALTVLKTTNANSRLLLEQLFLGI
jgi:DNA polymerase-3 subunit delta'